MTHDTDPVPPSVSPTDRPIAREAKRAGWVWCYVLLGFTLVGAGWSSASLVLAWKLDSVTAKIDGVRLELIEVKSAISAERVTRDTDRDRLVRLETTVGLMPSEKLFEMRRKNTQAQP